MKSPHFVDVAREALEVCGRKAYRDRVHRRVDDLVQEWASGPEATLLSLGVSDPGQNQEDLDEAQDWVLREYERRFGRSVGGFSLIGWLFWPVISELIRFLVRRTLRRIFPEASENTPDSDFPHGSMGGRV